MKGIELQDISKVFSLADSKIIALHRINLVIQSGEFVMLSGPSGSGKTTLLNIIGGLDTPSEGRIHLDGIAMNELSRNQLADMRYQKIGFIFQSFNLIPSLNVRDNIMIGLAVGRTHRKAMRNYRKDIDEIIETVGLGPWVKHRPYELSGGQQQRVAIARALIKRPAIILADEPTANLDSENRDSVMSLLRELNASMGSTCIVSTHDQRMQEFASRIVNLNDGKIVA